MSSEDQNRKQARTLWEEGVKHLVKGRFLTAVGLFNRSVAVHPTAEGYTYRGWAVSFLGMLDQAIRDCHLAIAVDPEFGNPYNDIGVYLMRQGQMDEAVEWLEKAKKAKRYDPKHFPLPEPGAHLPGQGRADEGPGRVHAGVGNRSRE